METTRDRYARSNTGHSPAALSATEAAKAAGLHRSSILRGIEKGRFPNAFRERGTGPWRIPIEDLRVAGLSVSEDGAHGPAGDLPDQVNEVQVLRELLDEMTQVAERALATLAVRDEQLTELRRTLQRFQEGSAIRRGRGGLAAGRVPPWNLDWFVRQAARTFLSFLPILAIVTVSLAVDKAYNIQLPIAAVLFIGYLTLGSWARLADQFRRRR